MISNSFIKITGAFMVLGGLLWIATLANTDITPSAYRDTLSPAMWLFRMNIASAMIGFGIFMVLVGAVIDRLDQLVANTEEMLYGIPVWPGPKPAPTAENDA